MTRRSLLTAIIVAALIAFLLIYTYVPRHSRIAPTEFRSNSTGGAASEEGTLSVPEDYYKQANDNAYLSSNFSSLEARASKAGSSVDDLVAINFAIDICKRAASVKKSRNRNSNSMSNEEKKSLSLFNSFSDRFCSHPFSYKNDARLTDELERLADEGNVEIKSILAAQLLTENTSAGEILRIKKSLESVAESTSSPYVFLTANHLLLTSNLSSVDSTLGSESGLNNESLNEAQQFGVLLATCEKFSVCRPDSIFAVRACMPYQCGPGFNIQRYLERRLSRDEMHEAENYARKISDRH